MPEIKIQHVVSCSSEDLTYKADNLLKADTYRKWKAAKPGEKQISVILQFEKSEQIHSIDIGNEGSAFVEVLVGNSTCVKDQDYEVILVTSSFMSPNESRNGTNLNRVRMFGPDKLVKTNVEKKWDRVKIVCTQPYNKSTTYGISFIKFHSPPDPNEVLKSSPPKLTKLGQFIVKEEEQGTPPLKPGSIFFNKKPQSSPTSVNQNDKPTPSYAAASLQSIGLWSNSSSPVAAEKPASLAATAPKDSTPGKRKFEFTKERQAAPPPPAKKQHSQDVEENTLPKATLTNSVPKKTKGETPSPSQNKSPKEKKMASKPPKSDVVEFHRILEGTVFVLSGFQNPFRAELRDKALAMGAKYRPDWTPDSTHLICAFSNTPKYSQVKSQGGKIVRKEWIMDCHKRKQRISYKHYLMDGAESNSEESENEDGITDEDDDPPKHKTPIKQKVVSPSAGSAKSKHNKVSQPAISEKPGPSKPMESNASRNPADNHEMAESSDEGQAGRNGNHAGSESDSGMDTEDELRRVEEQNRKKMQDEDPYGASTDENTDLEESSDTPDVNLPIPELPDFLTGKHFLLYGEFPNGERRMLNRYITAFNGTIEEYMNEKVQFVITAQDWDDKFEDALIENANLSFVKPRWIYACNDRQKLIPHQPYVVVPQM
ncbi:DNA repair protein XRCC1 isoform X1 [Polypterus senegalus]|uniref:DNA repair protein XRCC1 isoform X1 n=1 Tax=Polypterus senegalus TaxID=55291 RepID=UPI0019665105|nr:DNA repair protein XRCC1 isoform X1 [Polypterus senegalus]